MTAINLQVVIDRPDSVATQTYGDGGSWDIYSGLDRPGGPDSGITGIDDVTVNANDTTRQHGDGDVLGPHHNAAKVIKIPLFIPTGATATAALDLVESLPDAWGALAAAADMATLTITRLDRVRVFVGKPLGCTQRQGRLITDLYADAVCTFKVDHEVIGS